LELAKGRGIVRVLLDPPMNAASEVPVGGSLPVSVYPQTLGAPSLWSSGVTGRGVTLAVLDSGIQAHPDLGTPSRVILNQRFNAAASSSADQYGHGTWVAGIAAGNGMASTGRYRGIAPGASVVNLKVSDDIGRA
jgi:subtilisin family serine protease